MEKKVVKKVGVVKKSSPSIVKKDFSLPVKKKSGSNKTWWIVGAVGLVIILVAVYFLINVESAERKQLKDFLYDGMAESCISDDSMTSSQCKKFSGCVSGGIVDLLTDEEVSLIVIAMGNSSDIDSDVFDELDIEDDEERGMQFMGVMLRCVNEAGVSLSDMGGF